MPKWWNDMSWQGRLLTAWFAFAIVFFASVKILSMAGIEVVEPTVGEPRPPFSRKECLQRHQRYYFDRNPDMLELSDDQIAIVARRCANEESEYYYGR